MPEGRLQAWMRSVREAMRVQDPYSAFFVRAVLEELSEQPTPGLNVELLDLLLDVRLKGIGPAEMYERLEGITMMPLRHLPRLETFLRYYFLLVEAAVRRPFLCDRPSFVQARDGVMDLIRSLNKIHASAGGEESESRAFGDRLRIVERRFAVESQPTALQMGMPDTPAHVHPVIAQCYAWLHHLDEMVPPEQHPALLRVLEALRTRYHTPEECQARWESLPFGGEEYLAPLRSFIGYRFGAHRLGRDRSLSLAYTSMPRVGLDGEYASGRELLRKVVAELRKRCPPEVVPSAATHGSGSEATPSGASAAEEESPPRV